MINVSVTVDQHFDGFVGDFGHNFNNVLAK